MTIIFDPIIIDTATLLHWMGSAIVVLYVGGKGRDAVKNRTSGPKS